MEHEKSTQIFESERAWHQNNDGNSVRLLNAETLSSQEAPRNPALTFQGVWGRRRENKKESKRNGGMNEKEEKEPLTHAQDHLWKLPDCRADSVWVR